MYDRQKGALIAEYTGVEQSLNLSITRSAPTFRQVHLIGIRLSHRPGYTILANDLIRIT